MSLCVEITRGKRAVFRRQQGPIGRDQQPAPILMLLRQIALPVPFVNKSW